LALDAADVLACRRSVAKLDRAGRDVAAEVDLADDVIDVVFVARARRAPGVDHGRERNVQLFLGERAALA